MMLDRRKPRADYNKFINRWMADRFVFIANHRLLGFFCIELELV